MNKIMNKKNIIVILTVVAVAIVAVSVGFYFYGKQQYSKGYDAGYSAGYKDANKLTDKAVSDAVQTHTKTETKVIYQKIPYSGTDVHVRTEVPKVSVSVNGKTQEIQQHSETADLAVKTETSLNLKIPERRWKFGIGTDGKRPAYMLSAPIKGAVGAWVAGSGKDKIMGGVTVSF